MCPFVVTWLMGRTRVGLFFCPSVAVTPRAVSTGRSLPRPGRRRADMNMLFREAGGGLGEKV